MFFVFNLRKSIVIYYKELLFITVPNIPVVGVESFLYSANISQDSVLHCDLLYGSSLSSVYWQHNGLNLTYSSNKYNGSTIDSPSLSIYNVTYDDDGEYTCNVGFGEGSSPVIILNILARVEGMLHSFRDEILYMLLLNQTQ